MKCVPVCSDPQRTAALRPCEMTCRQIPGSDCPVANDKALAKALRARCPGMVCLCVTRSWTLSSLIKLSTGFFRLFIGPFHAWLVGLCVQAGGEKCPQSTCGLPSPDWTQWRQPWSCFSRSTLSHNVFLKSSTSETELSMPRWKAPTQKHHLGDSGQKSQGIPFGKRWAVELCLWLSRKGQCHPAEHSRNWVRKPYTEL